MKSKLHFLCKFISIVLALFIIMSEVGIGKFLAVTVDEKAQSANTLNQVNAESNGDIKKISINTLYAVKSNGEWINKGNLSNVYLTYNSK